MDEISGVYQMCAAAGVCGGDPRRVDELELWEIASVLGMAHPVEATQGLGGERDLVAERLYAAEHGLPVPEVDSSGPVPSEVAQVIPMRGKGV